MWIASKYGWFSIVKKNDGFHIRARKKLDLAALMVAIIQYRVGGADDYRIIETPKADYPCRIITDNIKPVMRLLTKTIRYSNFKSEIAANPNQKDKLVCYHDIWAIMRRYQQEKPVLSDRSQ